MSKSKLIVTFNEDTGLHGRPAAPRHAAPMAAAGHPHRRRPRRRRARRPDPAVGVPRRRPGDAGPDDLRAHREQPLPGQDRRRRVRHPALPGVADPLPLPRARRQGPGSPDGPPADPQLRPAAAGPPVGRAGPYPRRDRPQAGRVPVPDHRADQAARHAAHPGLPVRGRRHRGHRFRRAGCPRRRRHRTRAARRRRAGHRQRRSRRNRRGRRHRAGNPRNPPAGTGRARAGRWPGESSPGLLPAGMPGRCWCTPSPAGSMPRAC